MRVAVIPGDESGCGTYRMMLPANSVGRIRPDWQIDLYRPGSVQLGSDEKGNLIGLRGLNDPDSIDLIVMQRIGTPASVKFIHWALNHGIAVSIDADDALWTIDKANAAWKAWNGRPNHWQHMDEAAGIADLTTVTTKHLADRYGKHGRTEVVPNYVPEEVFSLSSVRHEFPDTVALGWTGFTATHPGDLKVVDDAVRRAVDDTGCVVRIVGDGGGAARDLDLMDRVESLGPQPLGPRYFLGLTSFDIGLVPLAESGFNRGKSSLKALEFSAMGLPVICSPTPANKLLGRDVPLLFASTPDEWYEHIVRLVLDPAERHDRGKQGREAVQQGWTIEGNAEQWARAWERAAARRARMHP